MALGAAKPIWELGGEYCNTDGSKHYQGGEIEPIELIFALGYGEGFCIGNIIKYAGRYGKAKNKTIRSAAGGRRNEVKRLTSNTLKSNFGHCVEAWSHELLCQEYWRCYDRLASYENTGLEPEDIALMKSKYGELRYMNGSPVKEGAEMEGAR